MRHPVRRSMLPALLVGSLAFGLAGCLNPQARLQSAEENEREKDLDILTVGDVTEVGNTMPVQVYGVGLVTHLAGTGGGTPPGKERNDLEKQLRLAKVEHVKETLDDPNNALVIVSALIPPGARKGDPLDVRVVLPPGSHGTSLRGGVLEFCPLRTYEQSRNLIPDSNRPNMALPGHVLAHAKGPLLVGLGSDDDPTEQREVRLKEARIWSGGVTHTDRPFTLILKKDAKFAKVANAVADRINLMFYDDFKKQQEVRRNKDLLLLDDVAGQLNLKGDENAMSRTTAKPMNKDVVFVNVPFAYRLNPERYLRVSRLIPLQELPELKARYRLRLRKMLNNPADSVRAALRLEALGKESVPVLRDVGLQHPHPLVRFCCAESLAYLGSTVGGEDLARLAREHVELQALCLKALAGQADPSSQDLLAGLMTSPQPALRCGAFRALRWVLQGQERLADKGGKVVRVTHERLNGEMLNEAYWLNKVAPRSPALANFAVTQRAEIILFGQDINLVTPVKIRAGKEFTITAEVGDDRCTVSRFLFDENNPHPGRPLWKQSTLRLEDVLRTMAALDAQYPDVVDFLRKLEDFHCLSCHVMVDAQPEEISPENLMDNARKNPEFLRNPVAEPSAGAAGQHRAIEP